MSLYNSIYEAGVVGAGGAGFPTHIKYKSPAKHLIINAAECEPLLFSDQYEMISYPDEIIEGIILGAKALEAEEVTIVIKAKFKACIERLEEAMARKNVKIRIKEVKTYYPAGDEHSAIYEATGEALGPGKLPIEMGIVVSNVSTMKNIYESTRENPVIRKVVTVSGEINRPSILDVPIGISIEECIKLCGGTSLEDYYILLGGPMMGKLISKNEARIKVITKTTGGILIFKKDHPIINKMLQPMEIVRGRAAAACIHCTFCTELCPRYLKGHPLHPHEVMIAFAQNDPSHPLLKQADLCCSCGICELYACPMELSPRMVLTYVKGENKKYLNHRVDWKSEGVRETEIFRKLPTDRLNMKLSISEYASRHYEDFEIEKVNVSRVKIPLSQHIGKPASPVVKVGDQVRAGDLIGQVSLEDMGANIHASISGIVREINENIIIEGDRK